MTIELKLTTLPESVSEATIVSWYKKPGERVRQDEKLADIETDKVILDIPAPVSGVLIKIITPEGTTIQAETVIGLIEEGDAAAMDTPDTVQNPVSIPETAREIALSPAVRNMLNEFNLDASVITATGKRGRLLKADIVNYLEKIAAPVITETSQSISTPSTAESVIVADSEAAKHTPNSTQTMISREPRRVPMSRIRSSIAKRLVEAQQNAAILTTFNEVDLTEVIAIRTEFAESFKKQKEVKLGFMSFFVKAVTNSLKQFPIINAATEGNDILYHDYFDIGIAVGSERGLVVPILRDADKMSFAQIESAIAVFAQKARDGSIAIEDISGGSFTITNGGVFGSLLSTPILNPPQSAILGLHKIQRRPIAIGDEIAIRPMMNLALSYDHRIIDGSDAVRFLVSIKNTLEKPASLFLEV
ncbi:MAG: 2-oxoglutarate dehydrogenase complex dihydrolipoyllysine-residue succinyltransferase [gamma proteobacterium symbiont of Taylorina sp.]|nr:2-oxoglutarate dehydrogenase complex dihydrolipoyllysine-residue succinyltransferase [gamma proteobacterium symbiont of Taylorina sp.]